MAVKLTTYYITSGLGGGGLYLTGQYLRVMADGTTITAELWTDPEGGTLIAIPSGGPVLNSEISVSGSGFNDFSYCDGSDLNYYQLQDSWPYANHNISVDHPSCAVVVCDLEITGYTVTNESTVGASDGQIALTSTSSNGTVKYSLTPDFVYASGQDSPITGLPTGNYIVFAKDPVGCTDQVNVFVGIDYTYGVKWRAEYDHVHPVGYVSRIDIKQRDYVGAVIETCCGETPFLLEYNQDDDTQLVPSMATIQLLVEAGEEGKFNDIRVGDDRQHVVEKYLDTGSGFELEWSGYITPEFYEEPYIFEPYVITLKALDGLGELKNKAFLMDSGEEYFGQMSVIKIISECLKKLPLQLEIRSCINIFEQDMETDPEDDPLAQAIIKAQNFRENNCDEVITSLIKPFTGAELFQSYGVWWIRTREQAVDSLVNYRVFDSNGDYVSNDSLAARKTLGFPRDSSRMCWIERSQLLQYSRPYGKVLITHDLDKDNNMIDSGGFELEDIDLSTEFFRDWNLFPAQTLVTAGLENVDNGSSKGAFFFQWSPSSNNQALNALVSNAMPISIGEDVGTGNVFENSSTSFKLKFQVYVSPVYKVAWIWLGWKLRFTDVDSGEFWDWFPPSNQILDGVPVSNIERINDIYITEYNSWKTYEFYNFRFPGDVTQENYTIQLSFYFHNHKGRDFSGFSTLRDFVTETGTEPSIEGKRFYVVNGSNTFGYELQHNTEAESEPQIIRPDDYNAISNPFQWVKIAEHNPDSTVPFLDKILIDNVSISIFAVEPNLEGPGIFLVDPPENATYEETITTRNESAFNVEVKNGDVPAMVGGEYIYNGFFTLPDGLFTKLWFRSTVPDERQKLLAIYLGYLSAQCAQSKRILSGSGIADIQIGYINSLVDQIDDRKYRFLRYTLDDKRGRYEFELEETLVGDDGESPPVVGAFSSGFSEGFLI